MSTAQYDIYQRKVFDLANTLVVKSGATADAINTGLTQLGVYVNDMDPRTWKYYLNLNGQYHATDTVMTVRSLDTLQTISFTRDTLQLHRATAREYAYGSEYYNDLVNRYPDQELLIRCILNPIEVDVAIAATDGQILYYNPALVEENETNLIPELNDWSVRFFDRWQMRAYAIIDNLYAASFLGVYFMQLPAAIMNIRLHNCHTIYAHSFHILEYLAGQGRLDVYANALTRKQLLWLYRNIRYLHRNVGKQETLELLTEHLLTERGFPLAEWQMMHNTADMLDEVYPDIEFARKTLNIRAVGAGVDTIGVESMLAKEIPAARSNDKNLDEVAARVTMEFENSPSNKLNTKVLESSILDTTDAYPYTLTNTLLNHWFYLSHTGRYNATITVDNPKTGGRMSINVKDAFILHVYLWARARGFELPHLPLFRADMIRKSVTPTLAELEALVSVEQPRKIPQEILANAPVLQASYISTEAFYRSISDIFDGLLTQREIWASQHDYRHNGWGEIQALHLYRDHEVDTGVGTTYLEWMTDRGMDFRDYTAGECELLSTALVAAATGADLKITLSLKALQEAMLRLMAQLSSYAVQFIQTINSDPIKVVDWRQISPTRPETEGSQLDYVNVVRVRPLDLKSEGFIEDFVDIADLGAQFHLGSSANLENFWDIGLDITNNGVPTIFHRVHMARIDLIDHTVVKSEVVDVVDDETENYVPLDRQPLVDAFVDMRTPQYVLTPDDRQTLKDRWDAQPPVDPINPDYEIHNPDLDGFDYPSFTIAPIADAFDYPNAVVFPDVTVQSPLQIPVDVPVDESLPIPHTEIIPGYTVENGQFITVSESTWHPDLGGFDIPPLQLRPTSEAFEYPDMSLDSDLDGFDIPAIQLRPTSEAFENPELPLNSDLDGFDLPVLNVAPTADSFDYPDGLDVNPDLNGFDYPDNTP